jgi:hypothetical protein
MSIEESVQNDQQIKKRKINHVHYKDISSQTDGEITSSGSDIDFQNDYEWSDLKTTYSKNKILNPIINRITGVLREFGKNAINILFEIKNRSLIEKEICKSPEEKKKLACEEFKLKNKLLIDAFDNEPCKKVQTQILSLINFKDFTKETIMSVIPQVTEWQIKTALFHANSKGPGTLFEKKEIFRERIDPHRLNHFLEFIVGEEFLHDVSYGTRVLKTAMGKLVIPNVIRLTTNSRLINLYFEECSHQNMKPLSKTSCFKILNKCTASFKQSMKGLDSMKVDGLNGFDKLEEIVETLEPLGLSKEKSLELNRLIVLSCNYLKFKYRKNLKVSSTCADHCVSFALSELNEKDISKSNKVHEFGVECEHEHTRNCKDCLSIEDLFKEIDLAINSLVLDESLKKKLIHHLEKSKESVLEWKHHIIRGFNQDIIKYQQLEEIKDEIMENITFEIPNGEYNILNSLRKKVKNKGIYLFFKANFKKTINRPLKQINI